jgi:tetratricopeptide (TPR) repeat protein
MIRLVAVSTFESAMPDERLVYLPPLLDDEKYAIRCEAARLLSVVPPGWFPADKKSSYETALQEYVESQNASFDHPAAHLNLAVLWEKLDIPEIDSAQVAMPISEIRILTQKSLDAYRQALAIDPDFLPARINLAMLHNSRNEPREAEAQLRRVTEFAPENGEGFYSLALLLAEQNRLDEAEKAFAKATTLLPGNARLLYNHGLLLLQLGKLDESEKQLIRAYQTEQNSVGIMRALVSVSLAKREYEKAFGRVQLLRRMEPNNPNWAVLFNQVQTQYRQEQNRSE